MTSKKWILLTAIVILMSVICGCKEKTQKEDAVAETTVAAVANETMESKTEESTNVVSTMEQEDSHETVAAENNQETIVMETEADEPAEDAAEETHIPGETEFDVFADLEELDAENLGNIG